MSTPITIVEVQPAPTNVIELQSPPSIVVESVGGEFIGPQGPPGPEGPPGTGGGGSLTSTVTPAALAASAAIGSSNEGARADHAHARPTLGELGAEAAGTAAATMAAHTGAADPHPQYAAAAHGHANATPSTPGFMAAADKSKLDGIAAGATANATDAQLRDRATHTGTQTLDTTTDSATRLAMTSAERTKLAGVATGATANATDAALRDRATHTGTQAASTISDFAASVRAQVEAALLAGANVTITPAGSGATRTFSLAAAGGGGGGASPGGADGAVQFSSAGGFGGALRARVTAAGHMEFDEFIELLSIASAPGAPASGVLRLYARAFAGRQLANMIGPSGVDTPLQPAMFTNRIMIIAPSSGTAVSAQGINAATAATLSHPALATTGLAQSIYRTRCATSTTAGNAAGIRHGAATMARGNANFVGGFYFHARVCSGNLALAGGQAFAGLSSSTAALAVEPSALADVFGLLKDSGDTAWHFARRTGTGTVQKVALTTPLTYAANQVLDVVCFSPPGGTSMGALVRSFNNGGAGTTHLDTLYSDNLPAVTTFLGGRFDIRNGTTAAAADFDFCRMYAESDF